ncbi:translationally controlled tumor protein [Gonapodya prolifera JEL478]|uniref:Translationally-controlled tumor protein homolog n=1 Tax=Gonapodya prolifera (strain JEL478) TaxID=1344416 RepID=A0A139A6V7_GONPJ|nr:translationally controlled tumor protein [Gonapodya prolifera JEL478]|eukprot:KXS12073.1 translationally controlled tumor protein [Gonapodya prolifera JEL478]
MVPQLIYKDVISGDEVLSDAYPVKEVDDFWLEADAKMIQVSGDVEVNIGGNPSAEGGDDDGGVESAGAQTVNNIVYGLRLQQTSFDKKGYMAYIKGYMKAIKEHLQKTNPDRVATFEEKAKKQVTKIVNGLKDYDFYTGENMNPEGMVILLNFREDGVTPYMLFFKDGLAEERV